MTGMKRRILLVALSGVAVAATLGGTLGVVAAKSRSFSLAQGVNYVGPIGGQDVQPQEFVACLPANSWNAMYYYDPFTESWTHWFNTANGYPAYLNQTGQITTIRSGYGVALFMQTAVAQGQVFFRDRVGESCTP